MRQPICRLLLLAITCAFATAAWATRPSTAEQKISTDNQRTTSSRASKYEGFTPAFSEIDNDVEDIDEITHDMELKWLEQSDRWSQRVRASGSDQDPDTHLFCHSTTYRKRTLKLVKEAAFIGLFKDLRNITRFEGSALTAAKGAYWAVFDSLRTIARIDEQFQFRGEGNVLIPEDEDETESQFEGLQYMPSTDTFLVVRESIMHQTLGLVPLLEELVVARDGKSWRLGAVCPALFFGLEDANKGWESIYYFEKGRDRFVLGMCESNYCKTINGKDPPGLRRGNGKLVQAIFRPANNTHACAWETVKIIDLPKAAAFLDYSGISFPRPFHPRTAITSQEDAAVWIGNFDWERMEFVDEGKVYHFPRDEDCDKIYCNVEGVTWLDHTRLMLASDRSKGTQDHKCMPNDQSVHIMAMP